MDHKAGYALGRGYKVIDKSLPRCFSVWELLLFWSYNFNPFTLGFQLIKHSAKASPFPLTFSCKIKPQDGDDQNAFRKPTSKL